MLANWRKLSLGCERKAQQFFMKNNTPEHLKGVNVKSLFRRRSAEQIRRQLAKQHAASRRERARCQEQEVRLGKKRREGRAVQGHADDLLVLWRVCRPAIPRQGRSVKQSSSHSSC